MRFCEKCGNLLFVERKGKTILLASKKCKKRSKIKGEKLTISDLSHEPKKKVVVLTREDQFAELPKTRILCPKCENMDAYWWMQQTRSADEPPTLFYRCCKCGYSWRSYG